jgi:hypothetical protein
MRLLTDPRIQNSPSKQFTNMIYAAVFHDIDHGRCAAMIRQLLTTLPKSPPASSSDTSSDSQAASSATSSTSNSSSGGLHGPGFDAAAAGAMGGSAAVWAGPKGCWATRGWLDVLEPFVWYLLEVLRRFRQDGSWQQRKEGKDYHSQLDVDGVGSGVCAAGLQPSLEEAAQLHHIANCSAGQHVSRRKCIGSLMTWQAVLQTLLSTTACIWFRLHLQAIPVHCCQ